MGMENYIFWSEIESGFWEPDNTPPSQEFPGVSGGPWEMEVQIGVPL